MPDVFISYSRKNKDFVVRLHRALSELNRDVWVDWEDIPLTADWWQEIRNGIEASDTFIFIISPDSLASPIAAMEISHAVQNNKRLMPIVLATPDEAKAFERLAQRPLDDNIRAALNGRDVVSLARENWQSLARHNWLIFDNEELFDTNLKNLLEALDTDLDHVRTHTRLLIRAREWESNAQNRSFLLRGDDLNAAEAWAQASAGKRPEITPLHTQYIFASHQAASQAQRALAARLIAGICVSLLFAALALVFGLDAQTQRWNAENNAATAVAAEKEAEVNLFQARDTQSLFMAALSGQQLHEGSPQDAILLALESLKFRPEIYHADSIQALTSALNAPIQEVGFNRRDSSLLVTGWNAVGNRVFVLSADGIINVWSAENLSWLELEHPGGLTDVDWDHAGQRLLSWATDGSVRVWDAVNAALLYEFKHEGVVNGAAWSPDDSQILSWSEDKTLRLIEAETGAILHTLNHADRVLGAQWNRDGKKAMSWSFDGTLHVWDTATGEILLTLAHDADVSGAEWNTDETYIATWTLTHMRVWHVASGRKIHEYREDTGIEFVEWSPDGKRAVTLGFSSTIVHLWEARRSFDLIHPARVTEIIWSYDSTRLLTVSTDKIVRVWDAGNGSTLLQLGHTVEVSDALWNEDDGRILTYSGTNALVWDASTGALLRTLHHQDNLRGAGWTRDGSRVLTWSWDKTMRLWDAILGTELSRLRNDGVNTVLASPTEDRLVTLGDDYTIRVWSQVDRPGLPMLNYENGLWSPTASRLLLWSTGDSIIHIWDETEQQDVFTLKPNGFVFQAVWNADGSQIFTFTHNGIIEIWDASNGELLETKPGYYGMVWNQTKTRFVTWREAGIFETWDVATGELLGETAIDGEAAGAEWSASTDHLLLSDNNIGFRVWDGTTSNPGTDFTIEGGYDITRLNFDGSRLITFDSATTARVWDTTTGEVLKTLPLTGKVEVITFSPDGKRVLVPQGSRLQIWDTETWEPLMTLVHQEKIPEALWSADASRILTWSYDRTARVWDAATGAELLRLPHEDWVAGAAWNKAETQILTWSYDRTVRVWDGITGAEILRLPHDDSVYMAAWNFDETRLISRADNLRVWFVDLEDYLALSQTFLIRDFSPEDRRRFFLPPVETLPPTPTAEPESGG